MNRRKWGITLACYLQAGMLPGKHPCQELPKAAVRSLYKFPGLFIIFSQQWKFCNMTSLVIRIIVVLFMSLLEL